MKRTFIFSVGFLIGAFIAVQCHGAVLFQDTFEYSVARDTAGSANTFLSSGPWDTVKSDNASDGSGSVEGGNGYLYTVTAIPGYSGTFPGQGNRALCIEALPYTMGGQTDFYLGLAGSDNYIPGNFWIQFWMYVNRSGSQMSAFPNRIKFIYPCADADSYPCETTGRWLVVPGPSSYQPYLTEPAAAGHLYFNIRDNTTGTPYYDIGSDENKLGQTDVSTHVEPNRWVLVKMHFNTSGTSNNSWEAWLRYPGGSWVKIVEWIGGTTTNFTWTQTAGGGHKELRIPTTIPANYNESDPTCTTCADAWIYLDDVVIAEAESDLPVYFAAKNDGVATTPTRIDGVAPTKKDGVELP